MRKTYGYVVVIPSATKSLRLVVVLTVMIESLSYTYEPHGLAAASAIETSLPTRSRLRVVDRRQELAWIWPHPDESAAASALRASCRVRVLSKKDSAWTVRAPYLR